MTIQERNDFMINLDMIFRKLEEGIPLEEIEVVVLEKLINDLDYWLGLESERADRAEQELAYYKRLANIRK